MAVEACQGLSLGATCSSDLVADGICAGYECRARGCGNGIVEGREVCDDGNTASLDGCAADCLSTETCGNGIVDDGEFCDCGSDAATKAAGCASVNSDDLAAQCDTQCMRYCGDGVVTGGEDCEAGAALSSSCATLGYYRGTLECAPTCRFDVSQCGGVCGDGVAEPAFGEECDQSAPSYSCVEIGFDYGGLSCNARCFGNVQTDCHRYGWRKIASDNIDGFWTSGNRQLLFGDPDGLVESVAGQRTPHPEMTKFSRNLAFAIAASPAEVTVFGAAGDRTIALPAALQAAGFDLSVTWTGEPVALDDQCNYWQHSSLGWAASALVQRPSANGTAVRLVDCSQVVATRNNGALIVSKSGLSYIAPGAQGGTVEAVSRSKGAGCELSQPTALGGVVVACNEFSGVVAKLHRDDPNDAPLLFISSSAVGLGLQAIAAEESNQQRIVDLSTYVFEGNAHDSFLTIGERNYPAGVPTRMKLFLSADGRLYGYGYGSGLWLADEFLGSQVGGWAGSAQDITNWTDDHGALAISVNAVAFDYFFNGGVQSLAAGDHDRFVVAGGLLYRETDGIWDDGLLAPTDFHTVHLSNDGHVIAVAATRLFIAANDMAPFQEVPVTLAPGCQLFDAFAAADDRYVVAKCGNETQVLRRVALAWQEIRREPGQPTFAGLAAEGTLYVATSRLFAYRQDTWQMVPAPPQGLPDSLVLSQNEIFGIGQNGLFRYADSIWGEMRNFATPSTFSPTRLAVTPALIVVVGEPSFGPRATVEIFRAPRW